VSWHVRGGDGDRGGASAHGREGARAGAWRWWEGCPNCREEWRSERWVTTAGRVSGKRRPRWGFSTGGAASAPPWVGPSLSRPRQHAHTPASAALATSAMPPAARRRPASSRPPPTRRDTAAAGPPHAGRVSHAGEEGGRGNGWRAADASCGRREGPALGHRSGYPVEFFVGSPT